ncbi:MAG: hypothetical protein WCH76_07610 [Candidatus Riflemargulisbacteria bacterium]
MKKLFLLLILLSGFMFSFDFHEGTGWAGINGINIDPLESLEVWMNGDSVQYGSSKIDVGNIGINEEFDVYVEVEPGYSSDFPIKKNSQPALYYAVYYGYSPTYNLSVTDYSVDLNPEGVSPISGFSMSQSYGSPSDPKFERRGEIKDSIKKILHVKNGPVGSSYMWLSFCWIIKAEDNQLAVKNKNAWIKVTIIN